ncbi:MAG: hypothetical protein IKW68_01395, partial [Clostridia bacterium]|nr:hypothetical protein [Clostridia bacterium]
ATLQYIPNFDWVGSFVDIRDCAFEKVEITVNAGTGNVSYVFLTEFPDIYDYVSFAGDGSPVVEIKGQPVGTTYTLDIPDDAVCFYVYMHDEGPVYYTPASIVFVNTDADEPTGDSTGSDDTTGNPDDEGNKDLTTYSYPMETVVASNGQITHSYKMGNNDKTHKFKTDGKERVAFIDITDLDYNTLTVTSNGEIGFLSFLTKLPTAHDEVVSYAPNYNDMLEINGTVTLAIPYCARYIAVTYHYDSYVSCLPASMVFSNTADAPSEMLKNDALDSYAYPMDTLKESQGPVADDGNKYIANFNWTCAFISLEGCVFDKVVFEVNEAKGFVSYGFLTEYPTLNQAVSFAGDATAMTTYEGEEPGTLITADIPDGAKVLVINWFGWASGAPDYTKPESITFIKDTDAGDEA